LQKDLEHDEAYYKNSLSTFIAWVTSLSDYHRNQQQLPSNRRIKQLKSGWMERIQMLRDSIATCTRVNDKRSNAFLKALEIVKDLEGPQFVRDSGIITKEQLENGVKHD
jgi:hypothetical protein